MKAIRNFSLVRVLLLIGAALSLYTMPAAAQSELAGSFMLPTTTHWSQVTLPAGEYSFNVELRGSGPLVTVRSMDNKWAGMFLPQSTSVTQESTRHELLLVHQGGELFVSSFELGDLGLMLEFNPPKAVETPALAQLSK